MRRLILVIVFCSFAVCGLIAFLFRAEPGATWADIPVYPGASSVAMGASGGSGTLYWQSMSLATPDRPQAVLRYYRDWYAGDGWKLSESWSKNSAEFIKMQRVVSRIALWVRGNDFGGRLHPIGIKKDTHYLEVWVMQRDSGVIEAGFTLQK